MRCQKVCPQNQKFIQWIGEEEEFSEKETALLLQGTPQDNLPTTTLEKLKRLDLIDYYNSLSRNLAVFFSAV